MNKTNEQAIIDQILIKILKLDQQLTSRVDKIEEALGCTLDFLRTNGELIDAVLDVLGVPEDNFEEVGALDALIDGKKIPDNAFCRDWLHSMWDTVKREPSDISVEQFPDWVRKELATID